MGGWDEWASGAGDPADASADPSIPVPSLALTESGDVPPPPRPAHRLRSRLILAGVLATVIALGIAASVVMSSASSVQAALDSVFSQPSLRVVITGHAANSNTEATLSQDSLVVTMTSENGSAPLSGSDAVDDIEVSVVRSGVDVADVILADHAIYLRVDIQSLDPHGYKQFAHSLEQSTGGGAAAGVAQAFLNDEWIGVQDSTIESLVKSSQSPSGSTGLLGQGQSSKIDAIRNSFTMSFAQAWDTWASIHQVSSSNGTVEYSIDLPVRDFVGTMWKDIQKPLANEIPSLKSASAQSSAWIDKIPASLRLPILLWVTDGSLSQVRVTYKGNTVNLGISHPAVGVVAPAGAQMITAAGMKSLSEALVCSAVGTAQASISGSGASGASGTTGSSGVAGTSGIKSGVAGTSGITGGSSGGLCGLSVPPISGVGGTGLSGVSGVSGISGVSGLIGSNSSGASANP